MPEDQHILDSGSRREFDSGAVRDIQSGKGRCDLLPLDIVSQLMTSSDPQVGSIINSIYQFMKTSDVACLYDAIGVFVHSYFSTYYTAVLELSRHYEEGAIKYGERNWEKGIPLHCYIDSGVRHLLKWSRKDMDEPHDRAFLWNMVGAIWTMKHHPELDDVPHDVL